MTLLLLRAELADKGAEKNRPTKSVAGKTCTAEAVVPPSSTSATSGDPSAMHLPTLNPTLLLLPGMTATRLAAPVDCHLPRPRNLLPRLHLNHALASAKPRHPPPRLVQRDGEFGPHRFSNHHQQSPTPMTASR
jgi:hypothetical protein